MIAAANDLVGMTYRGAWVEAGGAVTEKTPAGPKNILESLGFNETDVVETLADARDLLVLAGIYEPNAIEIGAASDVDGHAGVAIPFGVYNAANERPSFRERHPRIYRALRIGGLAVSTFSLVGLPIVSGVASAESAHVEDQIHETIYDEGKDLNSTLDDKLVFDTATGCSWFWISTSSDPVVGVNMTKIDKSMEMGGVIAFDYDKNTGNDCSRKIPYKVTKIDWIKNASAYPQYIAKKNRDDAISSEKSNKIGIAFALAGATVIFGIFTVIASIDLPDYVREQRMRRRLHPPPRKNKNEGL